jgi:hypothetical protein
MALLFAGGGESDTTGAAEAGQGADTTSGSLQDLVNNSISPFYIKKEIIEREEEDGMDEDTETPEMIGVVLPTFEQSDPGTQSEDEGTRGLAGLFDERAGEKRAFPTAPPEPMPVPRIDHRYHVVRGLRAKDRKGIDLNKNGVVPVSSTDGFGVKEDDRFAFNSNSFKVEKGRNISRSFDANSMMCVTCPSGGHEVKQGKDGLPVVFALSDQHFSPCLPTTDRKDCIRVLRVEDGYLREITGEFVSVIGKRGLLPGSVILLGSLTHLERDGTAKYAEEWKRCRNWIQEDLGGVMVLPLIPMPMEDITDKGTVRSLLEFLSWFEDLPETEVKLLSEARRSYVEKFLARTGNGRGWCDVRQSFSMPVDLSSSNTFTFNSRLWGNRPRRLAAFSEETERQWAGKLADELNRDFALNLSATPCVARKAEEIGKLTLGSNQLKIVFAGGSNAAKVAAQCMGPGITVDSVAVPGWRLAPNTVGKLIETISAADENTVFVLYGIGNVCFVSVDEDMRSGPPFRGRDGKFHAHGTLEVVSGVLFDRILTLLKDVVSACKGRKLILILPMPRYWIPCCEKGRKLDSLESDSEKRRLLKDLGRLRSAISGMVARLQATGYVDIISPLEALGVGEDLAAIEQAMNGPAHLTSAGYNMLARAVVDTARRGDKAGHQQRKRFRGGVGTRLGNRNDRFF